MDMEYWWECPVCGIKITDDGDLGRVEEKAIAHVKTKHPGENVEDLVKKPKDLRDP